MATWTELFGRVPENKPGASDVVVDMPAAEIRELLLDLPHHPNIGEVVGVIVELRDKRAVQLWLPRGESMASGATAPGAKPTTTVPALHQRHVRNVLSSAPVTAYTDDLEPGQAPPPAAPTAVGPSVTPSAGWLDGLTYKPAEKTSPGGIILPGDA